MSTLGAFFRGAAGPGLLALADTYERRDLEEAKAKQRADELKADQAFRADQAKQDRMARYGSDGAEPGMLAARRAPSAGGSTEGGGGNVSQAIADYAAEHKVSLAQARADFAASDSGVPNRTKTTVTNEGDRDTLDRRTATGATTRTDPDEERMIQVFGNVGKALAQAGPRGKSNYAQLTEGDGNAQRNKITGGMLSGALTPATAAEAVAASKGDGAYGKGNVNQFTGTPDAIGKSVIAENQAQAGSAGRANPVDKDSLKLPEAAKLQITDLNNQQAKLQELIDKASIEGSTTGKDGAELPAVADMRRRIQGIEIRKTRVLADNGAIDAKAYAQQVMDGESDPAKLRAAITQAKQIGGKFAADFVPTVQARLAELDKKPPPSQADARKGEPAPAKAAPAPAPAKAAAPADPASGVSRAWASPERLKMEADPEVKALREQIAASTSGRQSNALQAKLNALLAERYGL